MGNSCVKTQANVSDEIANSRSGGKGIKTTGKRGGPGDEMASATIPQGFQPNGNMF